MSAEAEAIGEGVADGFLDGVVKGVVEVAFRGHRVKWLMVGWTI
jgi:hypothetical protein